VRSTPTTSNAWAAGGLYFPLPKPVPMVPIRRPETALADPEPHEGSALLSPPLSRHARVLPFKAREHLLGGLSFAAGQSLADIGTQRLQRGSAPSFFLLICWRRRARA
jgi:hypothetical protein